jgi:hypothetical protein
MKKNVIFRIAAIVLMCTLVTACFASSTFAKYTSQATANGNALVVAKWSFEVNDTEIAKTTPTLANIDLFTDSVKDTDGGDDETDVRGNLIAPGTKGEVQISVKNTSDVTATYQLKVKRIVANDDLKEAIVVKYNGTAINWNNADANGFVTLINNDDTLDIDSAKKTIPLTWEWEFGDSAKNDRDTRIGIAAQAEGGLSYNLQFEFVANQVD